jgi:signal transduction histidine kinase
VNRLRLNHPFPLLLYLEWLLLCITLLSLISPLPLLPQPFKFSVTTLFGVICFGALGLWLPRGKLIHKIIYTVAEFGLILLVAIVAMPGIHLFPTLYAVIVMRSCLIFYPLGRIVVAMVALSTFPAILFLRLRTDVFALKTMMPLPNESGVVLPSPTASIRMQVLIAQDQVKFVFWNLSLGAILSFGLMLVFLLLLVNALLSERQSREKLAIANAQLRQYALRIEDQATLQERNRIARDIHDSLGHALTALNLQLEGALKFWQFDLDRSHHFIFEAKRLGTTALQEVRQSVSTLRSESWRSQSLEAAITNLAQEFYQTTGILPEVSWRVPLSLQVPLEVRTVVYRVVQEALTNICKHAAASEVSIRLEGTAVELHLMVQDNGHGFAPEQNTTGFGLQGMHERAIAIGGQLTILSQPGQGCYIAATFPLPRGTT